MYHYAEDLGHNKFHYDCRVLLPSTLEDPVDPKHPWDMNNYLHYEMYHYRRQDREYLYRRRERLLP